MSNGEKDDESPAGGAGAPPHRLSREDLVGMGIDPNDLAALTREDIGDSEQPGGQEPTPEPTPVPPTETVDPLEEGPPDTDLPLADGPTADGPIAPAVADPIPETTPQSRREAPASTATPLGYVITVGNEKGGSGKSTTAMHLIVALLRVGKRVGSIDLDNRQWTLTRYLANRNNTMKREGVELPMPLHYYVPKSTAETRAEMDADEERRFGQVLEGFKRQCDFIVIDCPGTDSHLGRLGHIVADSIVTPLNDSYIDFDMLAITDETGVQVKKPGAYAEMVFDARKRRMAAERKSIDWVVLRNRLSQLHSRNKEHMADAVGEVAKRIGFRIVPGFGERVIYRELFPRGLTMMDLFDPGLKREGRTTMSHIAARQEVRTLVQALKLPTVDDLSALGR